MTQKPTMKKPQDRMRFQREIHQKEELAKALRKKGIVTSAANLEFEVAKSRQQLAKKQV